MKCQDCDWEGDEGDLVEQDGELTPNDRLMSLTFFMGISRTDRCCPRCGRILQSNRNIYRIPQPPDVP